MKYHDFGRDSVDSERDHIHTQNSIKREECVASRHPYIHICGSSLLKGPIGTMSQRKPT